MAKDADEKIRKGVQALSAHFGRLVANHRRRLQWSQEELAGQGKISPGMIAKIETGATGVRFPMIIKIAAALGVEPVELFYSQLPKGKLHRGKLKELVVRLEELSENDLDWAYDLMSIALKATDTRRGARVTKPRRKIN